MLFAAILDEREELIEKLSARASLWPRVRRTAR
jgi:hypothetical protein